MPVSVERITAHVAKYSRQFHNFPTRRDWPAHLFHTAQVEVAAAILADGALVCRESQEYLIHDVANQGAIASNPGALKFARLYFRPKTMFHLKTEGIKSSGNPYRDTRHMSIPVTFAFDAVKVLSREGTGFSIGKMAAGGEDCRV